MKLTLCVAVLFLNSKFLFGQTKPIANEIVIDFDCWEFLERKINRYSDSLNFWDKGDLPNFIFNENLDYDLDYELTSRTKPCFDRLISCRKAIFDRVVNERMLKAIIESKNINLDLMYDPKKFGKAVRPSIHQVPSLPYIPYMEYSTRSLAKHRLEEVRKRRAQFKQGRDEE